MLWTRDYARMCNPRSGKPIPGTTKSNSPNDMMLLCTRLEPTEAKEEIRTQATGRRRQRDSSTTTLPIGRQREEKEKAKHQPRENPPRRARSLLRLKWTNAMQKEPISPAEKKDIRQMNALRKKSNQTMFASLRKPTVAKQNMKQNQMKQRISMERTQ